MCGIEELAGHGDHAVHEVGLDECTTDVAFAGLVGGHGAVGEDEPGHTVGREMVDEVLHPGEVGVTLGRNAILPAYIFVVAVPVGVVERRVGQHVVGPKVFVEVAPEGIGVFRAEIALDSPDGEIH